MEIIEFILFLFIQVFLLILTLWRKGLLFSLIGLLTTLFMFGIVLTDGVVVSRIEISGLSEPIITYANQTLCILILAIMIIIHALAILGVRK